jgi:nucleoside phosphorylase
VSTVGIQICSGTEWRAVRPRLDLSADAAGAFPYGEYVRMPVAARDCVFFHSRRTKTRAAGACQYAIDRWNVDPLLVLGTCGGVAPHLRVMDLVMAARTIQYDCRDQRPDMGLAVVADPAWLSVVTGLGEPIHVGTLASADQDVTFETLASLRTQDVLAADWESGAIAAVCALNGVRWAVLRGVSDVPRQPGDADVARQLRDYRENTPPIMARLLALLPRILHHLDDRLSS